MIVIAVICGVAAGGSFAIGGVLQQHVASTRPEDEELSFRLVADLAREPVWVLGIGLGFVSYVLESVALAYGPLVLVQPLIVTELLFALPLSIRWRGMRMGRREWLGAGAVTCGLAIGLVSARPGSGRPVPPLADWYVALAVLLALAGSAVALARHRRGPLRSSMYALAAGIVFATQAALLKSTIFLFKHSISSAMTSWQLWAMAAAAILGLLLVQSAYEAGPLATSMPVADAIEPVVAIVLGIGIFGEHVRSGLWLIGIAAGLFLLLGGIVVLDTSSLVRRLQQVERSGRRSLPSGPSGSSGPSGPSGPSGTVETPTHTSS